LPEPPREGGNHRDKMAMPPLPSPTMEKVYVIKAKNGWQVRIRDTELNRRAIAGRFENEHDAQFFADELQCEVALEAPKRLKKKIFKKIK